jgi:hypothetical protein
MPISLSDDEFRKALIELIKSVSAVGGGPLSEPAPVLRAARSQQEPQLDQINCRTSFREATDGRESDMIYVICVAALVLAAY